MIKIVLMVCAAFMLGPEGDGAKHCRTLHCGRKEAVRRDSAGA
jgi:hypothetical protein